MLQQILRLEGYIQNIYLAVYADKLLLLDGCCRVDVPFILDTIHNILGRDLSELKAVIVTHMHADHAGGASYLKQKTGCQIISANKSKQWYAGLNGRFNYLLDLSLSYFVAYRQGNQLKNLNYPATLYPDVMLNDGDIIPMFEDWQILETPGHTDRDLSVYHQQTGKLYVADLIIKLKHNKYVTPYNIHSPNQYIESLNKVFQLKPNLIMMAHGGSGIVEQQTFDRLVRMTPNNPRTNRDIYSDIVFNIRKKK